VCLWVSWRSSLARDSWGGREPREPQSSEEGIEGAGGCFAGEVEETVLWQEVDERGPRSFSRGVVAPVSAHESGSFVDQVWLFSAHESVWRRRTCTRRGTLVTKAQSHLAVCRRLCAFATSTCPDSHTPQATQIGWTKKSGLMAVDRQRRTCGTRAYSRRTRASTTSPARRGVSGSLVDQIFLFSNLQFPHTPRECTRRVQPSKPLIAGQCLLGCGGQQARILTQPSRISAASQVIDVLSCAERVLAPFALAGRQGEPAPAPVKRPKTKVWG
jgi:hypothetical protein